MWLLGLTQKSPYLQVGNRLSSRSEGQGTIKGAQETQGPRRTVLWT